MKKIISAIAVLALICTAAFGQKKDDSKKGGNGRERVKAEQIAYITQELELTESQAQAFWPVYNDVQAKRHEAFDKTRSIMKEIKQEVKAENPNSDKIDSLLMEYSKAKSAADEVDAKAIGRYKKVLPSEKVAKLVIAQEKFMHRQLDRIGGGHKGDKGPKGKDRH